MAHAAVQENALLNLGRKKLGMWLFLGSLTTLFMGKLRPLGSFTP